MAVSGDATATAVLLGCGVVFTSLADKLAEIAVGILAGLTVLVALARSLAWGQHALTVFLGRPITDPSDEWHPVSMVLLLLAPVATGFCAAMQLRRWLYARRLHRASQ